MRESGRFRELATYQRGNVSRFPLWAAPRSMLSCMRNSLLLTRLCNLPIETKLSCLQKHLSWSQNRKKVSYHHLPSMLKTVTCSEDPSEKDGKKDSRTSNAYCKNVSKVFSQWIESVPSRFENEQATDWSKSYEKKSSWKEVMTRSDKKSFLYPP